MTDITFADISEFQANIDAPTYIKAGHTVIINRVHNGYRADNKMPGRLTYLRQHPFVAVGLYQYLAQDRDPVSQAHEFIATIGKLAPNEFPILDHEEGGGNQTPRAEAWFGVVDKWCGFMASLYSGMSMLDDQLSGTAHWGRRPLWIARYLNSYQPNPIGEPPHCTWWQYSDRASFPGVSGGADGNIYHNTAQVFLARVKPGGAPAPAPKPPEPERELAVAQTARGLEVVTELPSGEIQHKWQAQAGGPWSDWFSLGTPGR